MDRIAQLLEEYDRPGPRYTSYPTAVEFHQAFGPAEFRERLEAAARSPGEPLSLYVHIPFCSSRCAYCGCNAIVTSRRDVADRYIDDILGEARIVAALLGPRLRVVQYHWGGGTPTYLDAAQMRRLFEGIAGIFRIDLAGEIAIEIHPTVTTRERIDALLALGFNRLSMGVQDFAPEVQEAIGRNQGEEETVAIYRYARERGFASINFDLIYGLPKQNEAGFRATIERVIALRPDRLAIYSYAHVPWLRPHQKRILPEWLPAREAKIALFALARSMLVRAGYEPIGMDHFALPDDELARAVRARRLWRNFMGYTVKVAPDMIGLGISSISDVAGAFAQTTKKLSIYHRAIDAGELPTERGFALSEDDRVRRAIITAIMCNFHLDATEIERQFGLRFAEAFAPEIEALREPERHGFVRIGDGEIEVIGDGRLFVRNIAMIFDRYLPERQASGRPCFSRTV